MEKQLGLLGQGAPSLVVKANNWVKGQDKYWLVQRWDVKTGLRAPDSHLMALGGEESESMALLRVLGALPPGLEVANLKLENLRSNHVLHLENVTFVNCDFSGLWLDWTSLENCHFKSCNFFDVYFTRGVWKDNNWTRCAGDKLVFRSGHIDNNCWSSCSFNNLELSWSTVVQNAFEHCYIGKLDLTKSDIVRLGLNSGIGQLEVAAAYLDGKALTRASPMGAMRVEDKRWFYAFGSAEGEIMVLENGLQAMSWREAWDQAESLWKDWEEDHGPQGWLAKQSRQSRRDCQIWSFKWLESVKKEIGSWN